MATAEAAATQKKPLEIPRTKKVRVFNEGRRDIDEEINGTRYRIPIGESIEVARGQARDICSRPPPPTGSDHVFPEENQGPERCLRFEAIPESGSSIRDTQHKLWCTVCGKEFVSQAVYIQHLAAAHPEFAPKAAANEAEEAATKKDEAPKVLYECPYCVKAYDAKAKLRAHVMTHSKKGATPVPKDG